MLVRRQSRLGALSLSIVLTASICLLLALGFLGTRGIWEPDEGRYSNVALTMLSTGDWLSPKRSEEVGHWTKPPGTYWLIAASVAAFGSTPWAARLPIALSFLACMLLAGLCARRLSPGTQRATPIIFGTMVTPFVAGQIITTDFPLAAIQALAVWAFVEYRFGAPARRAQWVLLMWGALGIGFMIKGPPALIPLVPVTLLALLCPRHAVHWTWHLAGLAIFCGIATPWYVWVAHQNPGLLSYFLGAEVIDRVASDRFGRNGHWYGWLQIYGPTLALGTLPWTRYLWRWLSSLRAAIGRWRASVQRHAEARQVFLAVWILVPVLVFCLAQSRLPLYILPIFVPIAIVIAAQRARLGRSGFHWGWLGLWVIVLLGTRLAAAHWPTHKNSAAWASAIQARVPGQIREVVFIEDMARYGLHLHLGAEVEKLSVQPRPGSRFNPEFDEALMSEIADLDQESGHVFVAKQARFSEIAQFVQQHGFTAEPYGAPYEERVIFGITPTGAALPPGHAGALSAGGR